MFTSAGVRLSRRILYKSVVIGPPSTGKTCAVQRFGTGKYTPNSQATIGVDFQTKNLHLCGDHVQFRVWDTGGQERFRSITTSYYRGAHAMFIMYDTTSPMGMQSIAECYADIQKYTDPRAPPIIVIAGCKSDLKRRVPLAKVHDFAAKIDAAFCIETSAKTGENIEKMFLRVAEKVHSAEKKLRANPVPSRNVSPGVSLLVTPEALEAAAAAEARRKSSKCC